MGIVNLTPDSFSDGGRLASPDDAVAYARRLAAEGADLLDIGGESSRPGAEPVSLEEELRRVIPVVEASREQLDMPISVDTTKAEVARAALAAGASIINDITALAADPEMAGSWPRAGAGVVLMHMQGTPATMQDDPRYDDVVARGLRLPGPPRRLGRGPRHPPRADRRSTRASASARRWSTTWRSCGTSIDLPRWDVRSWSAPRARGSWARSPAGRLTERAAASWRLVAGGVPSRGAGSCACTTSRRWSTRFRSGRRCRVGRLAHEPLELKRRSRAWIRTHSPSSSPCRAMAERRQARLAAAGRRPRRRLKNAWLQRRPTSLRDRRR